MIKKLQGLITNFLHTASKRAIAGEFIYQVVTYFRILIRRILKDNITMVAGNLSFRTLLSLVPFIAVLFFLLSLLPMYEEISLQARSVILDSLVPSVSKALQDYLEMFVLNSRKLTTIGAIGLFFTAVLVLLSVDDAINIIYRTKAKRFIAYRLIAYALIMLFIPLLLGLSLIISSFLFSLEFFDYFGISILKSASWRLIPIVFTTLAFWLTYLLMPTRQVHKRDALVGALVASFLFEASKKIFSLLVSMTPKYEIIYGVLAAIPIFVMWIYLVWCIILLGAEVAATLGVFRAYLHTNRKKNPDIDASLPDSDIP